VDVGCRNWSYVPALAHFFQNAQLTGIEVDGWRRYWNLYRRIDMARAYAYQLRKEGRQIQVLEKDFREVNAVSIPGKKITQSVFCFFFPFLSENPCFKWGLPSRFVNFTDLLKHAQNLAESMNSKPRFISSHQGEWEAEEAQKIYSQLKIPIQKKSVSVEESRGLWPSRFDTWIFHS
jgi:hypothetical protein